MKSELCDGVTRWCKGNLGGMHKANEQKRDIEREVWHSGGCNQIGRGERHEEQSFALRVIDGHYTYLPKFCRAAHTENVRFRLGGGVAVGNVELSSEHTPHLIGKVVKA